MYEFNKTTNFLKEKMNQEQNFKPTCENMEIGDVQDEDDHYDYDVLQTPGNNKLQQHDNYDLDYEIKLRDAAACYDEEEEEEEEVVEGLEFCGTFIRREQIDEMKQFFENEITKELLAAQEQARAAQQKVSAVYRRLRKLDVMSDKEILELVRR